MTPATATRPAKKKTRKVRFEAEGLGAVVTMENQDEVVNAKGIKVAIPKTGHRIVFQEDGLGGQFYETTDEAEIDFLRVRANMFGVIKEVPIMKPDSTPVLKQIITLLGKGDVDGLEALAAEEDETHEREDVLEALAEALDALK